MLRLNVLNIVVRSGSLYIRLKDILRKDVLTHFNHKCTKDYFGYKLGGYMLKILAWSLMAVFGALGWIVIWPLIVMMLAAL